MYRQVLAMCMAWQLAWLLSSCGSRPSVAERLPEEDREAKALLQGVWMNENTGQPMMRVEGDTIYYANHQNMPVAFRIVHDSIYLHGNTVVAYKIDRQSSWSFWFHSLSDDVVKLFKSDNDDDALAFADEEVEPIRTVSRVLQKDSVVIYRGTRYRGYVYVNPSTMKVVCSSCGEDGISVDNVYYDNVIHICVYEGRRQLYGKDFTKADFAHIFPPEQLSGMILSDMDFLGVDQRGYLYRALLSTPPEVTVGRVVELVVSPDGTFLATARSGDES